MICLKYEYCSKKFKKNEHFFLSMHGICERTESISWFQRLYLDEFINIY